MSLFFSLFTFALNLWHWKFVTADVTALQQLSTINMVLSNENKILILKKFVFDGIHSKDVDELASVVRRLRNMSPVNNHPQLNNVSVKSAAAGNPLARSS